MEHQKIALIGGGNMGRAMLEGILLSQLADPADVTVADRSMQALNDINDTYGVFTTRDNARAAASADVLILAVKPGVLLSVIREIREVMDERTLVISIVAGTTISSIERMFTLPELHLVRAMPNTPALAGCGMSALSPNREVTDEEMAQALAIFESFGKAQIVPEERMDVVTGLSGSSPAYVYMLIEAMADAAVADGMPRDQAYTFAAQTVRGAAKMVLKTGKHPGQLKDMVTSPGGTTIAGVTALEKYGFRNAVIEAVRAGTKRSKELRGE